MFKVNKGITLIALIITIITLLILAGVTISMIVGENGLISKAKESKENAIKSQYTEALKLTLSNMRIENSENIISECQKNPILADSTYTEYPDETAEYKVLILETKEKHYLVIWKIRLRKDWDYERIKKWRVNGCKWWI